MAAVDQAMAEAKCRASVANMEFLDEEIPEVVTAAREEILSGMLRTSRGTGSAHRILFMTTSMKNFQNLQNSFS